MKNKEKHISFAGKAGYFILGTAAGWSAAHYFGGMWPKDFLINTVIDLINRLGGLTAVVGAGIAIYNVYIKTHRTEREK